MAVVYFILYLTFITSHDNLNLSNDNEKERIQMTIDRDLIMSLVGGLADEVEIEKLVDMITNEEKDKDTRRIDLESLASLVVQYASYHLGREVSEALAKEHLSKHVLSGLARYLRFSEAVPWEVKSAVVVEQASSDTPIRLSYEGELVRIQPDNRPKGLSQLKQQTNQS